MNTNLLTINFEKLQKSSLLLILEVCEKNQTKPSALAPAVQRVKVKTNHTFVARRL